MACRRFGLLICLSFGFFVSGCASIISGSSQDVSFQSQPDGATVTVDNRAIGKTPLTVMMKKQGGQMIKFEKPGFKQRQMRLETSINPWFFGNIIFGGLFGCTTDGLSGAAQEYQPNYYFVSLDPEDAAVLPAAAKNRMKVKEYIVMSYLQIMQDMAKGNGEYLDSLFNLLKISKEQSAEALEKLKSLSDLHKDAPVFADKVMEYYNVSEI